MDPHPLSWPWDAKLRATLGESRGKNRLLPVYLQRLYHNDRSPRISELKKRCPDSDGSTMAEVEYNEKQPLDRASHLLIT